MKKRLRGLVSKKKKRFQEDGFDLDLTYVTPQLIAMGFPSVGTEAAYRNPLPEVQRFFKERHEGHYKIYNLCSERAYNINDCFPLVQRFPFDDHNPCMLEMIPEFCADVERFLKDPDNVAGIHCKAGKVGDTLRYFRVAVLAFPCTDCPCAPGSDWPDDRSIPRTHRHDRSRGAQLLRRAAHPQQQGRDDPKVGAKQTVRIYDALCLMPAACSQMRYVHYYERWVKEGPPVVKTYQITHVRLITVPNFDVVRTASCCGHRHGSADVASIRAGAATRTLWCESTERRSTTTRSMSSACVIVDACLPGARSSSPLNMCAYRVVCLPQIKNYKKESFVDLDVSTHNLRVRGNVKLMFFDYDAMSADDKVGIACIQTPWSGV